MKKLIIALFLLAFIAITASSCRTTKKPCPAYYSSSQTTQTINVNTAK